MMCMSHNNKDIYFKLFTYKCKLPFFANILEDCSCIKTGIGIYIKKKRLKLILLYQRSEKVYLF